MRQLEQSIVAVLNQAGEVVGTGFLVGEGLILTCAHVVEDAGGGPVDVWFHHVREKGLADVVAGGWHPDDDVALLQCDGQLPEGVRPLELVTAEGSDGHAFRTFGYPEIGDFVGTPARGEIDGFAHFEDGRTRLQLVSQNLARGHSGGPIEEDSHRRVVGMMAEVYYGKASGKHRDAAFAISADDIVALLGDYLALGKNRARAELILENVAVERLDEDYQAVLVHTIGALTGVAPDEIRILHVYEGSVVVVLELPTEAAARLEGLAWQGHRGLSNLGVSAMRDEHGREIRLGRVVPMQRPRRVEKFTGREAEVAQCVKALSPGKAVTLVGPGGMGKSAIAAEALWAMAPEKEPPARFPDGIVFHSFYGRPQAGGALEHLAASFGLEAQSEPQDAARRALAGREALVVLDGAEEADDLRAVLAVCGSCGVLVTTRSRQQAVGEVVEVEPLPHGESVTLMRKWAGALADEEGAVERICDLLGNLPLAVRLVGRYLREQNEEAEEFAKWLVATPLTALDFGQRRERSVPLLIEHSLAQVSEAAAQIVAVAGVLAFAPFPRVVMAAALGLSETEVRPTLGELVDFGLLEKEGEGYGFSHALVHTYARRRIVPSESVVEHIVELFAEWWKKPAEDDAEARYLMREMRPHVMTVLAVLQERQMWQEVAVLAEAVEDYLDVLGYTTDRVAACEAMLAVAQKMLDEHVETMWLTKLGNAYLNLGRAKWAIEYYEQALAIASEIGDRRGEGNDLSNLGLAYAALGKAEEAIEYYKLALSIRQQIGDRRGEGKDLGNLGLAYADLGRPEEAIDFHKRALAIHREINDRRSEGIRLGNLGLAYADLGQFKEAIAYYEDALAIHREIGDRRSVGAALGNLGRAYAAFGQVEEAIDYYEQALAIARETGDRRSEGIRLGDLGSAFRNLGQVEEAIDYYEQALAIRRQIGDLRGKGSDLGNLGNAYLDLERTEKAIEHYEQALAIAREIGDRRNEGTWLGNLGNVYRDLGRVEKAVDYYEQALAITREIGNRRGQGNHLGNLGSAYLILGHIEEAVDYCEQALTIRRQIGDRRGEGVDLGNLGNAHSALGQMERAIDHYQQALAIAREVGDQRNEVAWLSNLGNACLNLGWAKRASEYYEQALAIRRQIGDLRGKGSDLGNLGNAYLDLGRIEKAIEHYEQALAIVREIGDRRNEGTWLGNLGNVYRDLGRVEKAVDYYEQALAITREIGDHRGEATALANLGAAHRQLDEMGKAKAYWEEALAIFKEFQLPNAERVQEWLEGLP